MKEYYFDTNVYSHIHNRVGTTDEEEVAKLHAAVRADKIRILTSSVVVEETISALLSAEKEGLARLKLIRKLAKRKRIIKFHPETCLKMTSNRTLGVKSFAVTLWLLHQGSFKSLWTTEKTTCAFFDRLQKRLSSRFRLFAAS